MTPRSTQRLFATFAVVSLLPVLVLGVVLAALTTHQTDARGLARARSEAQLLSRTVVAPLLDGHTLDQGISDVDKLDLDRSVQAAIVNHEVLRLRLRDLHGRIVYADNGQLTGEGSDDEAMEAARGEVKTEITTLDADDGKSSGPKVVEAYEPLYAPGTTKITGVVELYVPYSDIESQLRSERQAQLLVLGCGLLGLWLVLIGLAVWVTGALRRSAAENAFLAHHDVLTGLPNRADFLENAALAVQSGSSVLALVDLDRFKQVNDTLGHDMGDHLLVQLALRLTAHLREGDIVARLGGDEFGLVLHAIPDETEALVALSRIRQLLSESLVIDDLPLSVEASVGFVLLPDDGIEVDALLAKADVAMYAAKRSHLGPTRYAPTYEQHSETQLRLIGELAKAIEDDQLVLHFQPKTELLHGTVNAVEALVRWQHAERGLLYPDAFLLAVEQTDLVDPLTRWVFRNALQALPRLDPTGTLSMAVNVSARSLGRSDFADEILEILAFTATAPERLLVEITETALLVDPDRALATLNRLASAGVRISIDDFGAGQTSLGYLATLPVYELKIDKAFVMAMGREPRNAAIVRSVIDLGHNLGFSVTAEGVETGEVLASLNAAGCDSVQGYYLARPADEPTTRDRLQTPAHNKV